jgi:hypothetical protein
MPIYTPVKVCGIPGSCKQNLKRPTHGTFLQKMSFLGVIVSENEIHSDLKNSIYRI